MRATCCVSPGSRLDDYEELIGLPAGDGFLDFLPSPGNPLSTASDNAALDRRAAFFFLAEIAMRRMLNRSKETRRRRPIKDHYLTIGSTAGEDSYAPIIASELEYQVEQWYQHLPLGLKFDRDLDVDTFPAWAHMAPLPDDHIAFLRLQYYGCQFTIYWPAVNEMIKSGEIKPDLVKPTEKFLKACLRFMVSITPLMSHYTPNVWTMVQRLISLTGKC